MKKTGIVVLGLVLLLMLSYAALTSAKTEKTEIVVKGMTCDNCVAAVTGALEKIDGVKNASVDLKSGKAVVEYEAGKTTLDKLESAIAKAGYTAGKVMTKNPHKCDSHEASGCPAGGCPQVKGSSACCSGDKK